MRRHKKIKSLHDFLFNAFDITKRNHCTFFLIHSTSQENSLHDFSFYPTPKMKIVARFPFLESATVALRNRVYDPDGQSVHAPLGS